MRKLKRFYMMIGEAEFVGKTGALSQHVLVDVGTRAGAVNVEATSYEAGAGLAAEPEDADEAGAAVAAYEEDVGGGAEGEHVDAVGVAAAVGAKDVAGDEVFGNEVEDVAASGNVVVHATVDELGAGVGVAPF